MDNPVKITSDVLLIDIEQHFRVSAGAGAGKTHWLTEHIKTVLHRSDRLAKTRKVACITYTNIAVETILDRLGTSIERVEVSTIHSFLYRYIVKPYVSFIADEYGLNVTKMDGHDDPIVSLKKILNWIESHPNKHDLKHPYSINQLTKLENNKQGVSNWLLSMDYEFKDDTLKLKNNRKNAYYYADGERRYLNKKCLDILELDLFGYKKKYWEDGIIEHNDVLFFSYQIIEKYPFVLQVLQQQFPYFFIDEFQDTNPIQTAILKKFGELEIIVGVIGDPAQSIYDFQGAKPEQFLSFSLPEIVDYQMAENRRSTNKIIDSLNYIRDDIVQEKYKNEEGEKTIILVGKMNLAYKKATELCANKQVNSLSWTNIISNAMKQEMDIGIPKNDLFTELYTADSNKKRRNLVIASIKAIELARENKFKDSIKELERIFRDENDKEKGKKEALKYLQILLKNYDEFKDGSLYDFYLVLKLKIDHKTLKIPNFKAGTPKNFYNNNTYQQLAVCVSIVEDNSFHKTIHKAKGDEFDNVLLILKEEKCLSFLLTPNLKEKEEHRVYYVALSRAKKRLFISVPSLNDCDKIKLDKNFNLIFLDKDI